MTRASRFHSYAATHVGQRRKNNEDAFLTDDALGLWVVADGMGGQAAGEIASRQAVETVHEMVQHGLARMSRPADAPPNYGRVLESAVQGATYMVFGMAEMDRTKSGMGTTLSAMLHIEGKIYLAQVGDSRIYRVRDGRAEQLTEDHTLVNWQIQQGLITAEEAKRSKQRNVITRAVGNRDYVQVDILEADFGVGDTFVLCSDGLHGYVRQAELGSLVDGRPLDEAVETLIGIANDRGGKDNITVALVRVSDSD